MFPPSPPGERWLVNVNFLRSVMFKDGLTRIFLDYAVRVQNTRWNAVNWVKWRSWPPKQQLYPLIFFLTGLPVFDEFRNPPQTFRYERQAAGSSAWHDVFPGLLSIPT